MHIDRVVLEVVIRVTQSISFKVTHNEHHIDQVLVSKVDLKDIIKRLFACAIAALVIVRASDLLTIARSVV